jgi:hypothetical protein
MGHRPRTRRIKRFPFFKSKINNQQSTINNQQSSIVNPPDRLIAALPYLVNPPHRLTIDELRLLIFDLQPPALEPPMRADKSARHGGHALPDF